MPTTSPAVVMVVTSTTSCTGDDAEKQTPLEVYATAIMFGTARPGSKLTIEVEGAVSSHGHADT